MGIKRQRPDGGEDDIDLDEQLLNLLPDELRDSDEIYLDDEVEPSRGKGGILAVLFGIVFGLVVAGVAAWYLLGGGMGGSEGGGAMPPMVTADNDPYKTRPEEPGGMKVENKDKLVYNRIAEADGAVRPEEKLLPEPEQPRAPPTGSTPVDNGGGAVVGGGMVPTIPAIPEPPPPPEAAAPEAPALALGTPPLPKPPVAAETEAPVAAAPTPIVPEPPKAPAPAPAVPAPPPAAAAPAPVAPTAGGAKGNTLIQVAALRSEAEAEKAWNGIQSKNRDLLGTYPHRVVRADLGDKGVYFRLRVGPVGDDTQAKALCETLKSRGQGCLVVR
jgi:hypothetical protein